jgi:arginyl-tRNA synthetase
MDLMADFRRDVVGILSRHVPRKDVERGLEKPPENIESDLAFSCFLLAKKKKKNPAEISKEISGKLRPSGLVGEISFYGPYINFFVDWKSAAGRLLSSIKKSRGRYGRGKPVRKRVMVEYSAPNTNKPLHLGHLKNGCIGMAVSNILDAAGYDVVRANLYSDRGSHICKSMLAYKKWGKGKKPDIKTDHFVGKYYVMFEKRRTEKLDEEVQDMLKRWEAGDKDVRALWKKMEEWGISGFKETYRRFGSAFDVEFRESDFWDKADPIIERGLRKKVFKKEKDGAITANLEKYSLGKKVIRRSDDTSIYITNDLALTPHKFERFKLDTSIWVVASEQNTYFEQLFKIFELSGFNWAKDCCHLVYGMVRLPHGRMKSREGRVVDADDLMDEMQELARKEISKREKLSGKELEKRSLQIALAAIKYYLLKTDTLKDMQFNPEESLSFDGDTGPYIQYSHARAMSILRKGGKAKGRIDAGLLDGKKEICLLKQLACFPDAIQRAAEDLKPHYMAGYAFGLATRFNEFYHSVPVINADSKTMPARLALVKATALVLSSALGLLGIEAPDRM